MASPAPNLAEKVAFLRTPAAYPEPPESVATIETHMAWVFLTDRHVYKLKKPVRHSFLDFSTLAAREADCLAEVRLNRRLAPGVYLGVVPLVRRMDGALGLGGDGETVDWLVWMRRLPAARMLDRALADGTAGEADIAAAATAIARFFAAAPPMLVTAAAYRHRIAADIGANMRALREPRYRLPRYRIDDVAVGQMSFLVDKAALFDARADGRCIVEGHGDLRPEHVALGPPPVVIDCLEFDSSLRILDPLDELAYLAMECERLGHAAVGTRFLSIYADVTGDRVDPALLAFYKGHRALLRAKIAIWHLDDGEAASGKWRSRALDYLELAEKYAAGT